MPDYRCSAHGLKYEIQKFFKGGSLRRKGGGEVAFFSFWICFIYLRYKRVYIHTNIKHIYKMNNYFSFFSQKNGQYRVCWSKVCRYTGYCVQRKYCYFGQIKLGWALADLKGEGVIMGLQPPLNYFFQEGVMKQNKWKCIETVL